MAVLEILDDHEAAGKAPSEQEVADEDFLFVTVPVVTCRPNRHHHSEGTDQQEAGVECAHLPVEVMMAGDKGCRVPGLHDSEANEQAPEEQDLRCQKQPHANFGGVELLLHRRKVMLMKGIVLVGMLVGMPALRCEIRFVRLTHFVSLLSL